LELYFELGKLCIVFLLFPLWGNSYAPGGVFFSFMACSPPRNQVVLPHKSRSRNLAIEDLKAEFKHIAESVSSAERTKPVKSLP
jgi:hypothetical protein